MMGGWQGIRFLTENHRWVIFGRKMNYEVTTQTSSQQPFPMYNGFHWGQLANVDVQFVLGLVQLGWATS